MTTFHIEPATQPPPTQRKHKWDDLITFIQSIPVASDWFRMPLPPGHSLAAARAALGKFLHYQARPTPPWTIETTHTVENSVVVLWLRKVQKPQRGIHANTQESDSIPKPF